MWPFARAQGFEKYLREALGRVEGWKFTEPFTPIFRVDGFHWGSELGVAAISGSVPGSTKTEVVLTVPAYESWLVLFASAQAPPTATAAEVRIAINLDGQALPVSPSNDIGGNVGVCAIWQPPYPVLFHPGDSIRGNFWHSAATPETCVTRVLRRRIPTTSNS